MQTNFFEQLFQLRPHGKWLIVIDSNENGEMIVSTVFTADPSRPVEGIPAIPLITRASAGKMDEIYFGNISTVAKKSEEVISNLGEVMKSLEQSRAQEKIDQAKSDKEKKEKTERRKRYDDLMEKVTTLEGQKKFGEAIGLLPKVADYPEFEKEITERNEQLRSQHSQLSMF